MLNAKKKENPESSQQSLKSAEDSKNYFSESSNPFSHVRDFEYSAIKDREEAFNQEFRLLRPQDWTPLIDKKDKTDAVDYGFSFGSKKVNMGPGFLNLKVMCQCLAKAIMKHLEFSRGTYLFLSDLKAAGED